MLIVTHGLILLFTAEAGDEHSLIHSLIPTTTTNYEELSDTFEYTESSAAEFNSFWKYKKLPKGPKAKQPFNIAVAPPKDPHKPLVFSDPVFDKAQKNTVGHLGKARVGEGNDITPNPGKLSQLGRDIRYINDRMSALSDSSFDKREKMKLSSRFVIYFQLAEY